MYFFEGNVNKLRQFTDNLRFTQLPNQLIHELPISICKLKYNKYYSDTLHVKCKKMSQP